MSNTLENLLSAVASGEITVQNALQSLEKNSFVDLGYAKPDLDRDRRHGATEEIYGEGKTAEQIIGICRALIGAGKERVLITRVSPEKSQIIAEQLNDYSYYDEARVGLVGGFPQDRTQGMVLIAAAGTSDLPVAEEAALTAEFLGNTVERCYDVGVSGLHRLLAHEDTLRKARAIVVVAGMEGALPSVVGGLVSCPVIAVPTSVGYGASFGGIAALLGMLNSCASGVSVVNIDNGFGAGYQASLINHIAENASQEA